MFKNCAVLLIILFFKIAVYGQGIQKHTLSVPKYQETDINALRNELSVTKTDTGKVWLLYKIAAIYWWRRSNIYDDLDSCRHFAQQAKTLGTRLRFEEGSEEATFLLCKTYIEKDQLENAKNLIKDVKTELQIRMLLVIGEHYLYIPGKVKANLDQSHIFLTEALRLAKSTSSAHWTEEANIEIGKYYFSAGDLPTGINYFLKVINYYKAKGIKDKEAHWWSDLAGYIPADSGTIMKFYRNSLSLYRQTGNKYDIASTLRDIARVQSIHQNLDQAMKLYLQAIQLLKEAKIKKMYSYYYGLADVLQRKGDFKAALSYSLMALNNMDELKDERMKGVVYSGIADICKELGQTDKSLRYYTLSMSQLSRSGSYLIFYTAKNITDALVVQRKYKSALKYLAGFEKTNPPIWQKDRATIYAAKANYYYAIKNNKLAERYYLAMCKSDSLAVIEPSVNYSKTVTGPEAYYLISKFYVDQKNFAKAAPYLKKYQTSDNQTRIFLKEVTLMQFKTDSAAGNYISAIEDLKKHTAVKDSMYNIANAGEMAKMEVHYETSQKEKDIRILQKESQLQQRRLSQSNQLRNFTFAGIVMLGVIIGIGYNRYRIKQSSYIQLQQKQQEINRKNTDLEFLSSKQGKLLEEKEWLIKEIHHRVKNNLQLITSLLKTQIRYIDSEAAIEAIKTSQHRMQAMSLVHTHLYQSDNLDIVQMPVYVHELLAYFRINFDLPKNVTLQAEVAPIGLDIIQAIPIGLIINEAITNAIKYAFPNGQNGKILLSLRPGGDHLELIIADNGVGLVESFDPATSTSFGMKLIEGLSQQIDASVIFRNENGLQIIIKFIQYKL